MNWEQQIRKKIDLVIEQIMAWGAAMTKDGKLPPIPGIAHLLDELYAELSRARLRDAMNAASSLGKRAMTDKIEIDTGDVIDFINRTPTLLSLLYDIDLLPEQIDDRSGEDWRRMMLIALHWMEHTERRDTRASDGWVP